MIYTLPNETTYRGERRQEPVEATIASIEPVSAMKNRGEKFEEIRVSQDIISRQKRIFSVILLMMS